MSGSPKFTQAELAERERKRLAKERETAARAEAKRRVEAEARERQRQLELARSRANDDAAKALSGWRAAAGTVEPLDLARLEKLVEALRQQIAAADSLESVESASRLLLGYVADFQACQAKRRKAIEEQQRREAHERIQWRLGELARARSDLDHELARKFDAAGGARVEQMVGEAQRCLGAGNLQVAEANATEAESAFSVHRRNVTVGHATWLQARAEAERELMSLQTTLAGLQADPVVMLWQGAAVQECEAAAREAAAAIQQERFAAVHPLTQRAQDRAPDIVSAANARQLKADERDAIVSAMRSAFEDMGFSVGPILSETPGAADSAAVFVANHAAGRVIGVSVPVDGQIWYDVDGYEMSSAVTSSGNASATCDDAEDALEELHRVLSDAYGVEAGEVKWEGKDPDRIQSRRKALGGGAPKAERGR